jgi:hypothetical protein
MNAVRKMIFLLGAALILFGAPPTVAAESDDAQVPLTINLAARPAVISPSARGTVHPRVLFQGAVVVVPCPASVHYVAERVSNCLFCDCRSNLRSLCLLRC